MSVNTHTHNIYIHTQHIYTHTQHIYTTYTHTYIHTNSLACHTHTHTDLLSRTYMYTCTHTDRHTHTCTQKITDIHTQTILHTHPAHVSTWNYETLLPESDIAASNRTTCLRHVLIKIRKRPSTAGFPRWKYWKYSPTHIHNSIKKHLFQAVTTVHRSSSAEEEGFTNTNAYWKTL